MSVTRHSSRLLLPNTLKIRLRGAPIRRIHSCFDVAVKAGIRPIDRRLRVSVFHRIEMNVFDVSAKIDFIPQHMLPVPRLPQGTLATGDFACAGSRCGIAMFGEPRLDQTPTGGEISVVGRQGPDAMKVVRQNDHGFQNEWPLESHPSKGGSQNGDVRSIREQRRAFGGDHRKEGRRYRRERKLGDIALVDSETSGYASLTRPTSVSSA